MIDWPRGPSRGLGQSVHTSKLFTPQTRGIVKWPRPTLPMSGADWLPPEGLWACSPAQGPRGQEPAGVVPVRDRHGGRERRQDGRRRGRQGRGAGRAPHRAPGPPVVRGCQGRRIGWFGLCPPPWGEGPTTPKVRLQNKGARFGRCGPGVATSPGRGGAITHRRGRFRMQSIAVRRDWLWPSSFWDAFRRWCFLGDSQIGEWPCACKLSHFLWPAAKSVTARTEESARNLAKGALLARLHSDRRAPSRRSTSGLIRLGVV